VRRIVRAAGLSAGDVVIEVGPGLGSLTLGLLPEVRRVVAVEVDPVLAGQLGETVSARLPNHLSRLEVVTADALSITRLPGPAPSVFVANLPYNIAVPVLLHLLRNFETLVRGLVMVQSEVAERLAALSGSRTYGVPSVKAAWYADVRRAGSISRKVFWPVPNVDSALIAFTRRPAPATSASVDEVFAVVDAAFSQRRKTLRSALAGWAGSAAEAERILLVSGVDPSARGESLDVNAFARIAAGANPKPGSDPDAP
jgi:16S rRNA (adenine1518-N6/adenine1519-N6)-dimethyltransferase